jgi:hypothetical protein
MTITPGLPGYYFLIFRIDMVTSPHCASMVTGVSIILLGYGFQKLGKYPRLTAIEYFLGAIMV